MMPNLHLISNVSSFISTINNSNAIKENCRKCKAIHLSDVKETFL